VSGSVDRKTQDALLAAVSAAQLGAGLAGLAVAVKRRRAYDFLMLHGRPDRVARDAVGMGTALSAPLPMLVLQCIATTRLRRGDGGPPRVVLGALGATMVGGYLGESLVRTRLRPGHWDSVESPIAVIGIGLAATMAVLAWRGRAPRGRVSPGSDGLEPA
jgi:hypothetical protein